MPAVIIEVSEVAHHLPMRGALLGLDVGTKTIGVATSDADRRLATGVETIARKTFTIDVVVNGEVFGSATGRAKKEAEQEAARLALVRLDANAQH